MTDIEKLRKIFIDAIDEGGCSWMDDGYDNPFSLDGSFDFDKGISAVISELVANHLASEAQWIEITGKQNEEIERLRAALTKFVSFYPMGINLELDEAFKEARATLNGEKTND